MINFTKMEGIGNDGIYVDCTKQKIQNPGELAYLICDRYFGIGANGLILIFNSKIADFRMVAKRKCAEMELDVLENLCMKKD